MPNRLRHIVLTGFSQHIGRQVGISLRPIKPTQNRIALPLDRGITYDDQYQAWRPASLAERARRVISPTPEYVCDHVDSFISFPLS